MLEAVIAAVIFSVVALIALTEIRNCQQMVNQGCAIMDLRRTGQRALDVISNDLRATTAGGGSQFTTTAHSMQYQKLIGYNTTAAIPADIFDTLVPGQNYSNRWQTSTLADGTTVLQGINTRIVAGYNVCGYLDPTNNGGFLVTTSGDPTLNVPTTVTMTIYLRRTLGVKDSVGNMDYVTCSVTTTIMLRKGQ